MQNNVAQNIELLEGAFGVEKEKVEKVKDGAEAASINVMNVTVAKRTLNEFVLKAVLTHPKGFQLLARAIETGILPHPSAILVLPVALAFTFNAPRPAHLTATAAAKEDRLLTALSKGLITIINPVISDECAKACLRGVMGSHMGGGKITLKASSGVRSRAELMNTVIVRERRFAEWVGGGLHLDAQRGGGSVEHLLGDD